MRLWSWLRTVTGFVFRRSRIEREMDEELRSHLELRAEDLEQQGLSEREAERQARVEFGGYQRYKEECREALGTRLLQELCQDIRYGLRQLRRNPGFTIVAVLTLALGIGANTAIFSVVYAALIRPLPYSEPGRLVSITEQWPHLGVSGLSFIPSPEYVDFRDRNRAFEGLAGYGGGVTLNLTGIDEPEHIEGVRVTATFFPLVGVQPFLGRAFLPDEDRSGGPRVVVLSNGLWQRHFGSDTRIIGRSITLGDAKWTVIGVMPPSFRFPDQRKADVLMPIDLLNSSSWYAAKDDLRMIHVLGRLRPHVTVAQAASDLNRILRESASNVPPIYARMREGMKLSVTPLYDKLLGRMQTALWTLFGAVVFVLLIACVNVANLQLARAASRQREVAVRAALGAGRKRVARQLMTESVLLASLGGAAGVLLAFAGVHSLRALGPHDIRGLESAGIQGPALVFALLIALLTGVLFGLAPVVAASEIDLSEALKESAPAAHAGHGRRLRAVLVMVEMALALALMTGSGLLMRSLMLLTDVDLGFSPGQLLTLRIPLPENRYSKPAAQAAFFSQVLDRVKALPGVASVAAGGGLPMMGYGGLAGLVLGGHPEPPPGMAPDTPYTVVSPGYFRTLGITLVAGREFSESDREGAPEVAIVNQTLARRYFPNQNRLGRTIKIRGQWRTIVGVIHDVKQESLDQNAAPQLFAPFLQSPDSEMVLAIRTTLSRPLSLAAAVRRQVQLIDKDQPVYDVATMETRLSDWLAPHRFSAFLVGLFAALALVLAAVGVYGLMSYSVAERTREFGIRLALGARPQEVLSGVVGQGLKLALIGVAIGIAGALALTRFLASLLFGVKPTDPLTFIAVSLILIAVALAACYIPACRAAKVDPMVALRYE
ncbi:MAG TPA: ABC transporter permease [Terriglobia bacterium]|nr:ABC transporter permease [Terriglobia bacterium]